jgi:recombinational DNA repair ATPase RecF
MRILNLNISEFKNLIDFSIAFEENPFAAVIVGQNGTGKSNLLEALIIIFRDLDLGRPPTFKYKINYLCRGNSIEVNADPDQKKNRYNINVNGSKISYKKFLEERKQEYLPNFVFGY